MTNRKLYRYFSYGKFEVDESSQQLNIKIPFPFLFYDEEYTLELGQSYTFRFEKIRDIYMIVMYNDKTPVRFINQKEFYHTGGEITSEDRVECHIDWDELKPRVPQDICCLSYEITEAKVHDIVKTDLKLKVITCIKGICGTTVGWDILLHKPIPKNELPENREADIPTYDTWMFAEYLLDLFDVEQYQIEEIPLCWSNQVVVRFTYRGQKFSEGPLFDLFCGIFEDDRVEVRLLKGIDKK